MLGTLGSTSAARYSRYMYRVRVLFLSDGPLKRQKNHPLHQILTSQHMLTIYSVSCPPAMRGAVPASTSGRCSCATLPPPHRALHGAWRPRPTPHAAGQGLASSAQAAAAPTVTGTQPGTAVADLLSQVAEAAASPSQPVAAASPEVLGLLEDCYDQIEEVFFSKRG